MPNYTNKITIMNLLGIIIGVCLFLMFCHMFKLLGKTGTLPDDKDRNEAGRGLRKTVESRVIK